MPHISSTALQKVFQGQRPISSVALPTVHLASSSVLGKEENSMNGLQKIRHFESRDPTVQKYYCGFAFGKSERIGYPINPLIASVMNRLGTT